MDIEERFEAVEDDYLKFDRVENKRSTRRDLHAYLLLHEIEPRPFNMVCAASHDLIYLDYSDPDKLTDEQILELVRCGVLYQDDSLCMNV